LYFLSILISFLLDDDKENDFDSSIINFNWNIISKKEIERKCTSGKFASYVVYGDGDKIETDVS
jgi:hypothetical protein